MVLPCIGMLMSNLLVMGFDGPWYVAMYVTVPMGVCVTLQC